MRALQFRAYGGPEVLEWAEAPDPHAGQGQIRIAVRAASVNPIDWKAISGAMSGGQPMVDTGYLGYDAAGVVDEVGDGVTGVAVGDEVFGRGQSTQAEYAVLDSWAVKPPSIDWAVAAAAGVAGETGERGLRLLDVNGGDTLFVDGGAVEGEGLDLDHQLVLGQQVGDLRQGLHGTAVGTAAGDAGSGLAGGEVGDAHHLRRLGGQADQLLDRRLAGDVEDRVDRPAGGGPDALGHALAVQHRGVAPISRR